jgi:ATP-dependent helicase/nuclease subunit A
MTTIPRLPFDDEPERGAPEAAPLVDARGRADAVDPRLNVVLEASAGTGKTRVLVDRYVNLVRAGVEPRHILAITFTRKAAAEMRERILSTLRRQAEEGGIDPRRWRQLREHLTDVAISTIDAFCLSLLREFPLEAGLDPGFGMADETEALRLTDEALDRALAICRGVARDDPAVALVFAELGDVQLRAGLAGLLDRRLVAGPILDRAVRPTPRELTPERVAGDVRERLAATLGGVAGGLDRFLTTGPVLHPRYRLFAADVLRAIGSGGEAFDASRIRLLVDGLEDYFFTKSGTPRKKWTQYSADHSRDPRALKVHRALATELAEPIAEDLRAFRRDLNAVLTRGVWKLFHIARSEYRDVLEEHALVDFPDALERALALLSERGEFTRSRYLLESRYQHLLVDEFQDTSDAQWRLVWNLVQSWREGLSMDQDQPLPPTIFVVGDRKQSIYGFRDADARVLARAAVQIGQLRGEGNVKRAIRQSFRAVPALLAFVNDVSAAVDKRHDRDDAFTFEEHDRFPLAPETASEGAALHAVLGSSLEGQAAMVADEIARIVATGTVRDRQTGLRRRAGPGDIAILFRSREGHQAFQRALESRGVASYVYKGLGFFDADEIKDVFALLRYLAHPVSNLRAAAFLRSRFARLSDVALACLGPELAQAVTAPSDADARLDADDLDVLIALRDVVPGWLARADRVRPSELLDEAIRQTAYAAELGSLGEGPAGRQARENLKKVRALVRRIENRGYATLARVADYLDRLSAGDESAASVDALDSVNLMTVHAAKGLEFPIVFVVNLGRGGSGGREAIRVAAIDHDDEIAVSVGTFRSAADEDATDRDREELKRLLYVALTRARDRLYLGTTLDERGRFDTARGGLGEVLPPDLRAAFEHAYAAGPGSTTFSWQGPTSVHRFEKVETHDEASFTPASERQQVDDDFERLEVAGPTLRRRISQAGGAEPSSSPSMRRAPASARHLGTLVHRLLEHRAFDATNESRRRELAARLSGLIGADRPEQAALVEPALEFIAALRRDERLMARLGRQPAWHEVPLVLREGTSVWRGAADAVVRPEGLGVAEVFEFKTGRPQAAHEAQLALYVAAIRAILPDAEVTGNLVYPDVLSGF